jgi:CBS domain-containing protein
MQVKEVMTPFVELTRSTTSIQQAARTMCEEDIGALPVGENDRLVGMVTDRDMTIRAVAEGRDPNATMVRDVMSRGIAYCFDDAPLEEARQVMAKHRIRRLPVLNRNKRLVGMIALADLARQREEGSEMAKEVLKRVSEPTREARR